MSHTTTLIIGGVMMFTIVAVIVGSLAHAIYVAPRIERRHRRGRPPSQVPPAPRAGRPAKPILDA
jgi:hypothetical protein